MRQLEWFGLYKSGWGNTLSPHSFSHPAKVQPDLSRAIIEHMLKQGYIVPDMTLVDPFAGIGGFAYEVMRHGLHFRGVELEPKFHTLAQGMDCPGFDRTFWRRYQGRGNKWHELGICPECGDLLNADNKRLPLAHWFGRWSRSVPAVLPHRYHGNVERWARLGLPGTAVILQGDSRNLAAVLGEAGGVVSSPPFMENNVDIGAVGNTPGMRQQIHNSTKRHDSYGSHPGQLGSMPAGSFDGVVSSPPYSSGEKGHPSLGSVNKDAWGKDGRDIAARRGVNGRYGDNDGNIANLPEGSFDGALTSSPYAANTIHGRNGIDLEKTQRPGKQSQAATMDDYGQTDGNLGHMPAGNLDAALSSPPYANTIESGEGPGARHDYVFHSADNATKNSSTAEYGRTPGQLGGMDGAVTSSPFESSIVGDKHKETGYWKKSTNGTITGLYAEGDYGSTAGNIGNDSGQTFWGAARVIIDQLYQVLKPGAYASFVCGDFVRKGERVYFGRQWLALCEAAGFEPVEWIVCWKREPGPTQVNFLGDDVDHSKDRVSFFRRLANQKNPDSAVLNEDVIVVRKPGK